MKLVRVPWKDCLAADEKLVLARDLNLGPMLGIVCRQDVWVIYASQVKV